MKLKIIIQLLSLAIALLFVGCHQEKETIAVTGVTLSQTAIEMTEGDTKILSATIHPSNAENKLVSWTSNNLSVASVQDGVITALNAGKAIITVTTEDSGKTAICEVVVVAKIYNVESVTLDRTSVELLEGEDITLVPSVMPENASNKDVVWLSSDETIATVEEGKVTTIKEGEVIVTVTTVDGNKTATCKLTVINDPMTDPIVFADPIIEGMCLDAFDTNNDGELSYKEAASVTDLTKMQLTNTGFVSFNEFQYFTSITTVEESTFFGCTKMTEITLPPNVTSIEYMAFGNCSSLTTVVIPEGLTSIERYAFTLCTKLTSIDLPNSINYIGKRAFDRSGLETLIIPDTVTEIWEESFMDCECLTTVLIPTSVTIIAESAFQGCTSLTDVILPESITTIGRSAFSLCTNLQTINIPSSVTSLRNVFHQCWSLKDIIIHEKVIDLNSAFTNCRSLKNIIIPESVTNIDYAFIGCTSLESIKIPQSVSSFEGSFRLCSNLKNVQIPIGTTSIGKYSFEECTSLLNISIPDSVTSIGSSAFVKCNGLTSVHLPSKISYIGGYAFADCRKLSSIYLTSIIPPVLESKWGAWFLSNDSNRKIFVPYTSLDTYKTAEGWSQYADDIVGYDYENYKVVE